MTRRLLLLLLEALAVALLVVAAGLFWAAHYIDTKEFRNQFVAAVEDLTGQTVELRGELDIALFPTLSLDVRDLVLLGKGNPGDPSLVRFQSLRVSARLMPLFSKRLEIRTIIVQGMELNIIRSRAGEYNWQAFSEPQDNGVTVGNDVFASVSLDGLEVDNASISYSDDQTGQRFGLTGIAIRTGAIVPGGEVPFSAKSNFTWKNQGIESEMTLTGMIVSDEESGAISLRNAVGYASVGGSFLPSGEAPGQVTAHIEVDWDHSEVALKDFHIRFLGLKGEGSLRSGDLSQGLSGKGHLTISPFRPVDLIRRYSPGTPVDSVNGLRQGALTSFIRFDEQSVVFDDMAVALDDTTVRGTLSMQDFSHPSFSFNLNGDSIDLDRYLPLFRTGTPFIWSDFHLDFFRAFRGSGRIRVDSFKLLDTMLSAVNLSVKADGKTISADAEAHREGQGPMHAQAEFSIGRDSASGYPTFGMKGELKAESQKPGFDFLNAGKLKVSGKGLLRLAVDLKPMVCPPDGRSISVLGRAAVDGALYLGAGQARLINGDDSSISEKYAKASLSLKAIPEFTGNAGYGFAVDASLRAEKGRDYEQLSLSANGPVIFDPEKGTAVSSGMSVKSQLTARLFRDAVDRVSFAGRVGGDSGKKMVDLAGTTIRVLETTLRVNAGIDASGKTVKASGTVELPDVNIHRIVYLLTGKRLRLNDPTALKSLVVSSDFTLADTSFTLNRFKANLDGLDIKGLIVGQGFWNPKMTASLTAGKFDLDRYLPASDELSLADKRAGKTKEKEPPVPLPLGFLSALQLSGKAAFEEFKLAGLKTQSLTGVVQADKGDIRISSLSGDFYGGKLTGDWKSKAGAEKLATHLMLQANGFEAGDMLKELAEHDYVRGRTDLRIDLSSMGDTDDAIVQNLEGLCRVDISKGSFKFSGYNAPKSTESPRRENLGQVGTDDRRQTRTVFSRARSDFKVEKGVFTADNFRVEAPPLLQCYGSGWFNLPEDTINLSIRNDFVAVPSVTIDIVGKLSDPEVKVPKGKILNDTVRNILSLPEKSFRFLRDLFL